jgi:predicted Zn finger-like uncharacterized protein
MDLTTRCPQCGATFSASLQQLQLRKGFIRCVDCAHIFDGYEAVVAPGSSPTPPAPLVAVPSVPPAVSPRSPDPLATRSPEPFAERIPEPIVPRSPASSHTGPAASGGRFTISGGTGAVAHDSVQDPIFQIGASPAGPDPKEPRIGGAAEPAAREPRVSPVRLGGPADGGASMGAVSGLPAADPIYVEPRGRLHGAAPADGSDGFLKGPAAGSAPWVGVFWSVLTLAGLVLLAAQVLYVYRAQIANQVPALRPMLEQACVSLACKVPYARRIDQITVTNSALRAVPGPATPADPKKAPASKNSPDEPSQMILQFTLRNAYDKPQEWPTMVLDLKDFSGTIVARKNLAPTEYLAPDTLSRPFPASSEQSVSLPIKLDGVKVNGYQLDKFFQ